MSKLKTAFYFGADAVYVGGKSLSLRALAGNFSEEEILEAVEFAHNLGKKVYVTVKATVTLDGYEPQTREIRIALVEESEGWRIDSPTYLSYNKTNKQ